MANPNPDSVSARLARKKRRKPGSLDQARAVLWAALETAEDLLENDDPVLQLRAVHAVSQAVGAYAKVVEVGELEARIKALEEAQGDGAGRGPRLGGAA